MDKRKKQVQENIDSYSSKTFAMILLIILLSIADAYLTLHLVNRGAIELNPIMAFYLDRGPLAFFGMKYLLTCAAVILILSAINVPLFGTRIQGKAMFTVSLAAFALVVQYELILVFMTQK
jgi:hypothetical protein